MLGLARKNALDPTYDSHDSDSSRIAMQAHRSTAKTDHQLSGKDPPSKIIRPPPSGGTEPCAIFCAWHYSMTTAWRGCGRNPSESPIDIRYLRRRTW